MDKPIDTGVSTPDREVRLGIVMYGGVSLAIYIYGVAREFYHATQGHGVYGLLEALTDSEITVDVISGTSAGGINGILLAYALCNGYDFAAVSKLWSEAGDIEDLLRASNEDVDKCVSVLDSEQKYLPRLKKAFQDMAAHRDESRPAPRPQKELDLFVTGTRVDGNVYTVFDDAGHAIDVKDYRTVFWLKHRDGRKDPFNPNAEGVTPDAVYGSLARLAAITSCFPAAFSPVKVLGPSKNSKWENLPEEDKRLQKWGRIGGTAYFLDGGILDNKPFTPTLKAIFSRVANCEVERRLFYVEPDPERFTPNADPNETKEEDAEAPNALQAAIAALLGIPTYESIADDLKLLNEHNSKVEQYTTLLAELQPGNGRPDGAARPSRVPPPTSAIERVYTRTRILALANRVVRGILWRGSSTDTAKGARGESKGLYRADERREAQRLVRAFDDIVWPDRDGDKIPVEVLDHLRRFDVYARLRRVVRVIYLLHGRLFPRPDDGGSNGAITIEQHPGNRASYRRVLAAFNRQLKLYEILIAHMEALVDETSFDWHAGEAENAENGSESDRWEKKAKTLWRQVETAFARMLGPETGIAESIAENHATLGVPSNGVDWTDWLPRSVLTKANEELRKCAKTLQSEIQKGELKPESSGGETLLSQLEEYEKEILELISDHEDCVRVAYEDFSSIDARIFPVELVADIKEKDVVRTIRVSPWDAQRGFSERDGAEKLAGDSVHHFGGFFKRSWRSNDVLWGRLDGLCQLIECVLTPDRLRRLGGIEAYRKKVRNSLAVPNLKPETLFPRSGSKTREVLFAWVKDLFAEDEPTRTEALKKARYEKMLVLLIEAAQLEIIGDEVPEVIKDAIEEQGVWNHYRASPEDEGNKYDVAAWQFVNPDGAVDPLVATSAAAKVTRTWIQDSATSSADAATRDAAEPKRTPLGRFFVKNYEVGSEKVLRHIPTVVLLGILSKALLAVRNSVLHSLGTRRAKVQSSVAYRLLIDAPLRAFDALVRIARAAPGSRSSIRAVVILAPIALVVIGIATNGSTMLSGLLAIVLWVLAPLLLLRGAVELFHRIDERQDEGWLSCLGAAPLRVFWILFAVTSALSVPASGWWQFYGEGIPKLRELAMAGTAGAAQQVLANWQKHGLIDAARAAVLWDFGLAAAYTATLVVAVARWLPRVGRLRALAAAAAIVAGSLDVVENVALLQLLEGCVTDVWAVLAAACAYPKFALLAGVLVLLIGAGASRRRTADPSAATSRPTKPSQKAP